MYTCYANKNLEVRILNGLSEYMHDEHNFLKIFNVWMKMIDKKNHAYIGGKLLKSIEENQECLKYRIYFSNGTNRYYMEVKVIDSGRNEILKFNVVSITEISASELESFTEASYICLKKFTSYFLFPVLGTFENYKELDIEEVIERYILDLYKTKFHKFDFSTQDMEQEILDYLHRSNEKMTRIGNLKYEQNKEVWEINFLQFTSNNEYNYFVQQSKIQIINGETIKTHIYCVLKDLGVSTASLEEFYFNNPDSNYQQIRKIPLISVFNEFFKTIVFIEKIRKMDVV